MFMAVVESTFVERLVGAAGTVGSDDVVGVAEASFDGLLVPAEFIAETLNVYEVPVVKPSFEYVGSVEPVLEVTVDQLEPLFISTLYPVRVDPPVLVGATQNKLIFVFDIAFAERLVGGFGIVPGCGVGVGVGVPDPDVVVGHDALELDVDVRVIETSFDLPLAPSG